MSSWEEHSLEIHHNIGYSFRFIVLICVVLRLIKGKEEYEYCARIHSKSSISIVYLSSNIESQYSTDAILHLLILIMQHTPRVHEISAISLIIQRSNTQPTHIPSQPYRSPYLYFCRRSLTHQLTRVPIRTRMIRRPLKCIIYLLHMWLLLSILHWLLL